MRPKEDQERQPLLAGQRPNYSAVPHEGMQTQTREDHAGTSDSLSSTAVDVDHLLATSSTSVAPREEPPHDAPEPTTAATTASLLTPSTTQQHLHKNVNTSPSRTLASTVDSQDSAQARAAARWNRIYRRMVWIVGLALIVFLLTLLVSPLVAQRVLDHAVVLQIQQTEISTVDDEGFAIHIKSSIGIEPAHDGVFGLTRWAQYWEPELTIEPTTLHLVLPHAPPSSMGTGSGSDTGPVTRRGDGGGRRMGSFHVPQQVVQMRKEATLLEITTHVNVTDASALAYFFQSALAESVLELGVEGQLRTHMGKLWPLNLQLTTLVPVEGMKGIQDATLVSMALPGDDPRGGVTIEGVARLHNPSSSLSVDLGRLTFGVYLSNNDSSALHTAESKLRHQYKVAELLCSHVELKAHETVDLAVAGRLLHLDDWVPVSPALTALHILKSEKQLMLSGLLSRYIQGEDSVVAIRALPEPEMVRWLQVVVQSIALNVRFPGSPQKDFIQGIDMKQLSFGFDKNVTSSPSRSAEIRGRLTTHLQLPKNVTFPITVAELYPEVELFRLGSMSDGGNDDNGSRLANPTPMARINLPGSLPAESVQNGNALQVDVSFESGSLVVFPGQEQTFYGFLNESFTKDKIILGVTGQARALVETGMGTFELGPIPFTTRTTQKGLGGLIGVPPKLEQIDVVDSTENSLTIKARLVLINPSSISASLGSLSFFWGYNGFLVGLATVPSAALVPGPNTIETLGMMDSSLDCRQRRNDPTCDPDDAAQAARAFLSGYISGDNTTAIDILGHAESTKIPLLQPLISSLTIRSSLPVMEQDFLLSTTMYLLSSSIVLELLNPLDTPIWVLYINGTAFYKDEPLGHIRVDFERDITTPKPIEIPANDHQDENSGYTKTPRLPVSFELSSIGYEALKQALGGTLEVGILCHIKARVGNMVQWIDYHKDSVPTKVRRGLF